MDKVEESLDFVECSQCLGFGECWLVIRESACCIEMGRYRCPRCGGRCRVSARKLVHDEWSMAREAIRHDDYQPFVLPLIGTLTVLLLGVLGYAGASALLRDAHRLWDSCVYLGWGSLAAMLLLSILDSILAHKSAYRHRAAEHDWSRTHPEPPCPDDDTCLDCCPGS